MNVSGTLHFYSGKDRELFFVFDDVVAQEMYRNGKFDINDFESRRVYISVGSSRFIHQRTLNFSRKQTEIKVSLCSRNTKGGLAALTALYDWFASRGDHPDPFGMLGHLTTVQHAGISVWELTLTEPADLVTPPGLPRRRKATSPERRSFEHRREIQQRDLTKPGRNAEKLALRIAESNFSEPDYLCLWRKDFLDSEKIEIRKMGVIADIDVWDATANWPKLFIEVKAQKIGGKRTKPLFYLSSAEWRSYQRAKTNGVAYEIWLFQYQKIEDLENPTEDVVLVVFEAISELWLKPDGHIVAPPSGAGRRSNLRRISS